MFVFKGKGQEGEIPFPIMDAGGGGGGASGGGPAPFLLKTYEMVDDGSTDAIVSWSVSRKSFVVWDSPEFQRILLPTYFKHNNFSSFIRQLNTYGFRKVDPERWEFANEDFIKDQKHLLKNIYRRKPIHSHSQPPQGSVDQERSSFEEEINRLSREKSLLEANLSGFKDHCSEAKAHLETLTTRIVTMEHKQERLLSFFETSLQNPDFVELLSQKLDQMDFSYNKKRRLPWDERSQSLQESSLRPEPANSLPELDLRNKLRLELSPAVSDVNQLSHGSAQSSNEEAWNEVHVRPAGLELSDTGASSCFNLRIDSVQAGPGSSKLRSLHDDEGDDRHLACLLNLSLASSALELSNNSKSQNPIVVGDGGGDRALSTSPDVGDKKKETPRVNDVFWEQFLTERPPDSSDN